MGKMNRNRRVMLLAIGAVASGFSGASTGNTISGFALSDQDAVDRTVGEDSHPKFSDGDEVSAKQFGLLAKGEKGASSAVNAKALKSLRTAAETYRLRVNFPAGIYELPAGTRLDANNSTWVFAPGAVLKLHDEQAATDFIAFIKPVNQKLIGLKVDANRAQQNSRAFGADRCAVLVVNAKGCTFLSSEIISSPGKGFGVLSTPGGTTSDMEIRGFKGGNCSKQVLIVDGNNMAGFFKRVVINDVRIGATSHAGVALNDGASDVTLSDVVADVQSGTWDAVSIRDSWDIKLSNVRGSRGRNGLYLQRLNGFCGRIEMDNVVGEENLQNGILIAGAEDVVGGVVVGRNNAAAGINITAGAGGHRCKNIRIAAPSAYDNKENPTQQYGILVQGADNCRLGKSTTYGNTKRNVSVIRSEVLAE
ncbi:hypothetical protein [Massilia sp. Root133]|uniref:hypothetical protein n=1 Tax=Massilia sp. Root133 TaxID=1736455 RepID=UPI000B153803|nr:hypothetical protein [Massilia sp. Root133]